MNVAAGRLDGRVAIVTGAGQGLGKAIAAALADEGSAVALLGRTRQKVVDASKELADKGYKALAVECDVANRESVDSAVAETLATFGRIDILVNNAQGGSQDAILGGGRPAAWHTISVPALAFGVARGWPPTRWRRRR